MWRAGRASSRGASCVQPWPEMFRESLAGAPARRFFVAHAQSCLGTGLAYVALPLLAYERFDSAWAVSAVLVPDPPPAIGPWPPVGRPGGRGGPRTGGAAAAVAAGPALLFVMAAGAL